MPEAKSLGMEETDGVLKTEGESKETDGMQRTEGESKETGKAQEAKEGSEAAVMVQETSKMQNVLPKGDIFKAGFLGMDSSQVGSCTVYHGEAQEDVDLSVARGKYLLEIISRYFEDPKYKLGVLAEVLLFDDFEKMVKDNKDNYYILLQFSQPSPVVLERYMRRCVSETVTLDGYDRMIVEVDPILDIEGYKEEGLADIAKMYEGNYYILLSFTHPTDIFLYDKEKESLITLHSYDSMVFHVDQEEKTVSLDCRQIGDENQAFWPVIGFTKKRAVKDFITGYEAWKE